MFLLLLVLFSLHRNDKFLFWGTIPESSPSMTSQVEKAVKIASARNQSVSNCEYLLTSQVWHEKSNTRVYNFTSLYPCCRYCECFAAGVYCVGGCRCSNCYNRPEFEDIVLQTREQIESRNPSAFVPKIIRAPVSSPTTIGVYTFFSLLYNSARKEPNIVCYFVKFLFSNAPIVNVFWTVNLKQTNTISGSCMQKTKEECVDVTPAPTRHKRGCNCKKSQCSKKYCECYQVCINVYLYLVFFSSRNHNKTFTCKTQIWFTHSCFSPSLLMI